MRLSSEAISTELCFFLHFQIFADRLSHFVTIIENIAITIKWPSLIAKNPEKYRFYEEKSLVRLTPSALIFKSLHKQPVVNFTNKKIGEIDHRLLFSNEISASNFFGTYT
jgi:hypothetical protein